MSEYTQRMLARNLVTALLRTCIVIAAVSVLTWIFLDRRSAMVVWVGAGVIALPQIWLASSLFSRFGAQVPALLGAVKFGLSALLFGAWFVTTSDPQPGALFLGAMVVLVSSPVFYHLAAKHEGK